MPMVKYAKARVIHPHIGTDRWNNFKGDRRVRVASAAPATNLVVTAEEIFGKPFNPKQYLLTHATIVGSVDTATVPSMKLGAYTENGVRINRKYADFRVKTECDKFINNNLDCWSRGVILASYKTFIGGHNFVEHVQVEDLSKGRILDAVARDIGNSVYVDILIATERKHKDLIAAIENGKMGTLSMGCFLPGTQVSLGDGRRIAIEDVQPGDMVLTHKGRAREVLNKQIRGGKWGIRRIQAVGVPDTIEATDNHPFFVFRQPNTCACGCGEALPEYKGGRKNATRGLKRRFKTGHDKRILNPNNTYSMQEYRERKARLDSIKAGEGQWVRADELRVGDFLCFPRNTAEGAADVSLGRARLLGYYLAEGSFQKHKGELSAVEFSFSMSEKDTFVAEVVDLLRREFPGREPNVYNHAHRNVCSVRLVDREAAQWFFNHGGEYSNHKTLSVEVMQWPVEAHKHLIGTWINGDGYLHRIHDHTSGTTTSYNLACQMHMLMARCGWFARMEAKVGARCVEVREIVNGGFVRDEVTGKLPHFNLIVGKTQAVEMAPYTAKAATTAVFDSQGPRVRDDVVMFPITSIEESTYTGLVHNMEVEEDNSYVVSGICSHNCTVDGTICTKCGHWAADETEMCPHVKYEKGNIFYDDNGTKHRVAELCGHQSIGPTGGVEFIEASWVQTPAFTGAVLRNVLEPNAEIARQAAKVLSMPPKEWRGDARTKAATMAVDAVLPVRFRDCRFQMRRDAGAAGNFPAVLPDEGFPPDVTRTPVAERMQFGPITGEDEFDTGGGDAGGGSAPVAPAAKPPTESVLKKLEDEVYHAVTQRVKKRVDKDLQDEAALGDSPLENQNENISHQASYNKRVASLLRTATNNAELLDGVARLHGAMGIRIPVPVYRVALALGGSARYGSVSAYLKAGGKILGRTPTTAEASTLRILGRLLSQLKSKPRG